MTSKDISEELKRASQIARLEHSNTKPLYVSAIEVEGESSLRPLSDALYKAVFDPILSQPVQTLHYILNNFSDIRGKLMHTGLFQDVNVTLENDGSTSSVTRAKDMTLNGIQLGSVLPAVAHIKLSPLTYNTLSLTSTTSDSYSSAGGRLAFVNLLGKAENFVVQADLKYTPFSGRLDEKCFDARLLLPLQKNPSVKGVLDLNYASIDPNEQPFLSAEEMKKQNQVSLNFGVQKSWILENLNSVPVFYNGISLVSRNVESPVLTGAGLSSELFKPFEGSYVKSSFVSEILHDSRKFAGLFPTSGSRFSLMNEYVLSQSLNATDDLPAHPGHDKIRLDFEKHASLSGGYVINSLQLGFGGLFNLADSLAVVHPFDKFYLGGLNTLKGFANNSVGDKGGLFYFKASIASSFRLFHSSKNSPLRLQFFMNAGDVLRLMETRKPASSSGVSLIYRTNVATMDLTYALPVFNRKQDITKAGFSFGVALSFY
ncbi:LAMI_0E13850g1_1 [Lachancea mirantina]|uniref:LAMI_0E13850g1_1 n=1 Tax=Lachancea mirantina TaxID=1230905 RepID=A0A1G4JR43_9SACH|nr:LAMI_0E13850g1_1 [Lachancea mirantina]